MSLKGRIKADHIPLNKYALTVVGLPEITFLRVSGLESGIEMVELPDRTRASGGQVGTSELTVSIPSHHSTDVLAMELWFKESQDPITATYKKPAILTQFSGTGAITRTWQLSGCWNGGRAIAEVAFENAGELATIEYTLHVDEIIPLPV